MIYYKPYARHFLNRQQARAGQMEIGCVPDASIGCQKASGKGGDTASSRWEPV